jgi:simple sugar transport system permease protein
MITSFFVMQLAISVVDWLVASPLRDRGIDLVATAGVDWIGRPSGIAWFACACACAFVAWFWLKATISGFETRLCGDGPGLARDLGVRRSRSDFFPMALSGASCGVAGFLVALSDGGRTIKGASGGLGWDAIGVVLIAGLSPGAAIAVCLAYAWIDSGTFAASISGGLSVPAASIAKAALLAIAATGAIRGGRR